MANITSEADLQACYLDATADYTVTADITVTADFRPYAIANYSGTFDGGNYTITDFQLVATANEYGLCRQMTTAGEVKNLNFDNVSITQDGSARTSVAVVCGKGAGTATKVTNVKVLSGSVTCSYYPAAMISEGTGTITNCENGATITYSGGHISGGMIGFVTTAACNISNCKNTGTITGTGASTAGACGGMAGYATVEVNITDCENTGTIITPYGRGGGMIGYHLTAGDLTILRCTNSGNIGKSGTGYYASGMVAHSTRTTSITYCTNSGNISMTQCAGGMVGYAPSGALTINNCSNTGSFSVTDNSVGGIVGFSSSAATISDCYSTGDMTAQGNASGKPAGGFIGYSSGNGTTITNCYATGDVDALYEAGGFIGYNVTGSVTITKCYATGNVTSNYYTGGFIGRCNRAGTVIDNCYSTGNVTYKSIGHVFGGFAGYIQNITAFRRCYSTGNVTGSSTYGGGFIAYQGAGTTSDCFSTGTVTGFTSNMGMFCGYRNGTISNCGCRDHATTRDIGNPAGDVTYSKADPTEWYDATENVYDAGTYVWDFTDPAVWYEWSTDYPKFTEEPVSETNNAVFFGCHF